MVNVGIISYIYYLLLKNSPFYKNLRDKNFAAFRTSDADAGRRPIAVENVLTMRGRFHPVFDGEAVEVGEVFD